MEKTVLVERKFSSPAEEIAFLRAELEARETARAEAKQVALETGPPAMEQPAEADQDLAVQLVQAYARKTPAEVLTADYAFKTPEVAAIVLDLAPEAHDRQMEELLGVLETRGIKNALSAAAALNNPHLEDDFHRFLIQYLRQARPERRPEREPLKTALNLTLFEVVLPESQINDGREDRVKSVLALMEQLYAGLQDLSFSLELAVAEADREIMFYAAVPAERRSLLEKQVVAFFPGAKVTETKNDYNIFNPDGVTVGAVGRLLHPPALSLKTYEQFDYDPLNVLINGFAKLDRPGEGAAFQLVCRPTGRDYAKSYQGKLVRLEKGEPAGAALREDNLGRDLLTGVGEFFFAPDKSSAAGKQEDQPRDQLAIESVKRKLSAPVLEVNLRLLASAPSRGAAEAVLTDLESAFGQLAEPSGNKLVFDRLRGRRLAKLFHYFSFRLFNDDELLPLNFRELSAMFHFPSVTVRITDGLKQVRSKTAPPPGLPAEGIQLGENRHQGRVITVQFAPEDRLRHFYTVGQTGTGKSTLLKNMAIQDIKNGEGVCFIDPHGVDVLDVLSAVPSARVGDLIYFDPAGERPLGLNLLEYNADQPDQKTFVVNELLAIFNKLFDMKTVGGPIFEQYFRNSALLALEASPAATLLDVARILAEPAFRHQALARAVNPIIKQFWLEVAEKAGGEASLQNIVPYVTSKFDAFLTNDIMRPILLQRRSAVDFRQLLDERKILLVNLAKGRLGEINANLLGLILVGKLLQAALSRVDRPGADWPPFYLYIDEFQNVTTTTTAAILSEARKYKLALHLAHQFIAQIDDQIKDAVFGNVGTLAVFRVGIDDAKYLEPQFTPVFSQNDLVNLDNRHAYLRLLVDGKPARPFDLETWPPISGDRRLAAELAALSQQQYGRPRAEVEAEIAAYYRP